MIAGQNAQQNERIVKRHLSPDDVYVHADIQGAASVIIKIAKKKMVDTGSGHGQTAMLPLSTLQQAATMALCLSSAWTCNVVTGAFWVYGCQVSKTPPAGQYLGQGSFMIYGKKNYLMPSHLFYGFGFLFKVSNEKALERIAGERTRINFIPTDIQDGESVIIPSYLQGSNSSGVERDNILKDGAAQEKNANNSSVKKDKKKSVDPKVKVQKASKNIKGNGAGTTHTDADHKKNTKKSSGVSRPLHNVRGTAGKLKKIKEKYKDQDKEEQLLRMSALGVKDPQAVHDRLERSFGGAKHWQQGKNSNNEQGEQGEQRNQEEQDSLVEGEGKNKPTVLLDEIIEADALKDAADSHIDGCLSALDLKDSDDSDSDEVSLVESADLDEYSSIVASLTGDPHPSDNVSYAIAMCAPWSAFQNFRYRVKLVPGPQKKGKAVKSAVQICLLSGGKLDPHASCHSYSGEGMATEALSQQHKLMKTVKDEDMIHIMLQNTKVVAPSTLIQKIKKDEKKTKKQSKKT